MNLKAGQVYKSTQSGQLYKYIGTETDKLGAWLNFERVSGAYAGELDEFSKDYVQSCFELQVEETKPKGSKYSVTMTAETPAELRDKAYKLFELAEEANDARLAYGDAQSKLETYLKEVE